MNTFKKLTVAAATAAAVGGISAPANAVIQGVLGEAWLVPLALHGAIGSSNSIGVNTYVTIKVPDFVGVDSIPNVYTAPHSTGPGSRSQGAENFASTCEKGGVDVDCDFLRWFWFTSMSVKKHDGDIQVTPDDAYFFDLRREIGPNTEFNVPGYLVFTPDAAAAGGDANFASIMNAWLVLEKNNDNGDDVIFAIQTPALPMADGADSGIGDVPQIGNEVIANNGSPNPTGFPTAVSPIVSGIRIANGDGDGFDQTRFHMDLGFRDETDNLLVVWLDDNYDAFDDTNFDVWDHDEHVCSGTAPLDFELNLIWIEDTTSSYADTSDEVDNAGTSKAWHLGKALQHDNGADRTADDRGVAVCVPAGVNLGAAGTKEDAEEWFELSAPGTTSGHHPSEQKGVIQFTLDEGNDRTGLGGGLGTASAAGAAFTVILDEQAVDYVSPNSLDNFPGGLVGGNGDLDYAAGQLSGDEGKIDN